MNKPFNRLTLITHVDVCKNKYGKLTAYAPLIREIDLWCELFEEVHIYAPNFKLTQNTSLSEFKYENVFHHFLFFNNSANISDKFYIKLLNKFLIFFRLFQLPIVFLQLLPIIYKSEIINLRSPGYPALLANIILKYFIKRKTIVKWAGGYHSYPNENIFSKFERKLLLKAPPKTKILVYDTIKHPNFVHFIPALMSVEEIKKGQDLSKNKNRTGTTHIVCVGRLAKAKNFDLVLNALGELEKTKNYDWHFYLIGEGSELENLETIAHEYTIKNKVTFVGAIPFNEVQEFYSKANIVIMPGIKEGWPKIIAEAWAHNALVFAANRGNVPDIIEDGSGIPFEPTIESLSENLQLYFDGKINFDKYIAKGREKVFYYSIENFKKRLYKIINSIDK
jgi:glycosyltransferase involved in cell wall biosynthesis